MNSPLKFWFLILWLEIGVSGFWARGEFWGRMVDSNCLHHYQ